MISSNLISSAGDMRVYLQNLLDSKEKQLQQAGTFGQRVLAQQMELEDRIRQLQEFEVDKSDDNEVDPEVREKCRELEDNIMAWDSENAQLSSALGASLNLKRTSAAPSLHFTDLPHENPAHVETDQLIKTSSAASTSAAVQSRRAKNAAHRADDVEFAFEIGSGLLTEVRRLQDLLGERDKATQNLKAEKDDLQMSVESVRTALRQQEQSADKFKEENWNLEVSIQELRTQLTDMATTNARLKSEQKRLNKLLASAPDATDISTALRQQEQSTAKFKKENWNPEVSIQKLRTQFTSEQKRLNKLLASAREAADAHQNESERVKKQYEDLKLKYENDMALARKDAADLQETDDIFGRH